MDALSKEELLAMLGAAKAHSERDWLMILVGYWYGYRNSEVRAITPDSIRDGYITMQRLKGSERTTQPLYTHPEPLLNIRQALIDYAAKFPRNQRLFPVCRQTFWRIVQRHGKTAGVPVHRCHPHSLKHTMGTEGVEKAGLPATQKHLGHKSGASTMQYAKKSQDQASIEVARVTGALIV